MTPKTHLLLLNLGTPRDPSPRSVREYLAEFLMDPWVIDIPWIFRWLLIHGYILRTRPARSSLAYQKIWTDRGSPLLFHTRDLAGRVQQILGDTFEVVPVMRYGEPSLEKTLRLIQSKNPAKIAVFPLYPQFSLAATASSRDKTLQIAQELGLTEKIHFIPPFYGNEDFLDCFAEQSRPLLADFKPGHVLFSFHGLPERQIKKTDPSGTHCFSQKSCCEAVTGINRDCYRAQSFATAAGIAARLSLSPNQFTVSFQSRLGRTPWIQPFTDLVLPELASQGKKRIAVFCPSFVADCLETLEEIQIRAQEDFKKAGGEELMLVPSLNASERWAQTVARLARQL